MKVVLGVKLDMEGELENAEAPLMVALYCGKAWLLLASAWGDHMVMMVASEGGQGEIYLQLDTKKKSPCRVGFAVQETS